MLIVDNGWTKYGIGSEISSLISENIDVKIKVKRIGIQDSPIPSTISLAKFSYPKIIHRNIKKIKQENYTDKTRSTHSSFLDLLS